MEKIGKEKCVFEKEKCFLKKSEKRKTQKIGFQKFFDWKRSKNDRKKERKERKKETEMNNTIFVLGKMMK